MRVMSQTWEPLRRVRSLIQRQATSGSFVVFFFSSRRRHTRSLRDWSSDVCSSDLELGQMAGWFALPNDLREGTTALAERFGCGTICVTRGSAGAALLHDGRWSEHPGYRVDVKDTVEIGRAHV